MDSVALTDIGPIFDKRRQRGLAAAWASVLIVFSGSGHERDLAAMLRRAGIRVEVIDTKDGGRAHDVLANGLGDHLVRRVERGDFDAVFIATPCSRPSAESAWRPWLNLWICPIKDGPMRRRTGPMQIRRRGLAGIGCPRGSDPMCVYDAIVAAWEAQTDQPFPSVGRVTGPLADVPFFRCSWKRGSPVWNTAWCKSRASSN